MGGRPPSDRCDPLPAAVDVAVVGAGYTGLHAALVAARAGRSVAVFDAGALGQGCSTRNGGQLSTSIKPGYGALVARYGEKAARAILEDGIASRRFTEAFVREEGIDCDFRVAGRFHAAHSPRAQAALVAGLEAAPEDLRPRATVVPRASQAAEIGSDACHGGAVFHDHAELDPGRYHAGLLARAAEAGATLHAGTEVTALDEAADGVTLATSKGAVRARDVVLATNGYSGGLSPWHARRVIPIGSYIIATEPIAPDLMAEVNPRRRILSDSRRVVYYWRTSPDNRRILFGGRVAAAEIDLRLSARRLHAELLRLHPQLAGTRVSHSWMGFVGYSFDSLAHLGRRGRVHHAMGYCGSGVGMAGWLGHSLGLALTAQAGGAQGLGARDWPTRPLYSGRPWFLPAAVAWKRGLDRLGL